MAEKIQEQKVLTENVYITVDEAGEPEVLIRKDQKNGGRVQVMKLVPMGFGDIPAFLDRLTQPDIIIGESHPGMWNVAEDLKVGETATYVHGEGLMKVEKI